MSDEFRVWLRFAEENLATAELCYTSGLFNPCLQNSQQTVEKALKGLCRHHGLSVIKTHNIVRLVDCLAGAGIEMPLTNEECVFFNGIYLPSKYPLGSALPDYEPDERITLQSLEVARRIMAQVRSL